MSDRLEFHEEQAQARDVRFTGFTARKAAEWRHEVQAWYHGPRDAETLEALKLARWAKCGCGRSYQPGERDYRQCYTCSQASYADGSTACAICQRRHSMSFPCCRACQTLGNEDTATLLRSIVMRRDGYACNACGETEGQLDVHHIDPQGSAWQWNLEILCTPCWITFNASKKFGSLDELVWLERAEAYNSYLREFLDVEESRELREQLEATLGSDFVSKPSRLVRYGKCDPLDGMLNVLDGFGRQGIEVSHV